MQNSFQDKLSFRKIKSELADPDSCGKWLLPIGFCNKNVSYMFVMTSQNEDWKQMFGAAPIERSMLTSSQKSKSPVPPASVTAARSEKELSQLLMSASSSTEHLAMTRSGSAGQLGMSSTATVSSASTSALASSVTRLLRQPLENTQRGMM